MEGLKVHSHVQFGYFSPYGKSPSIFPSPFTTPLLSSFPSPFRQVCEKSNLMFKSAPRALFITLEDRGRVFRCERSCRAVRRSDGPGSEEI